MNKKSCFPTLLSLYILIQKCSINADSYRNSVIMFAVLFLVPEHSKKFGDVLGSISQNIIIISRV